MATALAEAIARLEERFGARTVVTASTAEERAHERRFATGTSFDRLAGGIASASALAFVAEGTSGKITLALRAVAGAQADGGMACWVDPSRSFDPLAAHRAGVDLPRLIVVRPSSRDGVLLAASAALRSEGFRLVVADLGPSFAAIAEVDDLAPLLPLVRGSTSALLVLSDAPGRRVLIPTYEMERMAWERRFGRTSGWTFGIRRVGAHREDRAILHVGRLGGELGPLRGIGSSSLLPMSDAGLRSGLREAVG
ncbi:MAG: hypothetical protein AAB284_00765 [Chloroflexota bacterium]|mgnify:FL=1